MPQKIVWIATFLLLLVSAPAHADVAPEPCEMSNEGDACQTYDGDDGTCVEVDGLLECLVAVASTSSGGTTTPTPAAEESGCAVVGVGEHSGSSGYALLVFVGLCFVARKRS